MVKFSSRIGHDASRLLLVASVTSFLVACGGGSGDSTPLGDQDFDMDDIINSEDPDADGDLVADVDDLFVDLDSDGFDDRTGLTEEESNAPDEMVAGDNDGDGFIDVTEDRQCGGASARNSQGIDTATDAESANSTWDDNCHVRAPAAAGAPVRQSSQFANSYYTVGIQRVVYCSGFGDGDSYVDFADGLFGGLTTAAVASFQETGEPVLTDDGIVGGQTWGKLQDSLTRLALGTVGDGGISFDSYGFTDGRCAGVPLFYQQINPTEDPLVTSEGGWELARNQPNEAQRAPFTTAFGDLFR